MKSDNNIELLSDRIRQVRIHFKIKNQKELGELLEITPQKIADLESGRVLNIKVEEAMQFESFLKVNPWWLMSGQGQMLQFTQPFYVDQQSIIFHSELEKIEKLAMACVPYGEEEIINALEVLKIKLFDMVRDNTFVNVSEKSVNDTLSFASKLRLIRKTLKFDQKKMSQILQTSQSSYCRLESNQDLSATELKILFDHLRVSPLWFFSNIDPMFLN